MRTLLGPYAYAIRAKNRRKVRYAPKTCDKSGVIAVWAYFWRGSRTRTAPKVCASEPHGNFTQSTYPSCEGAPANPGLAGRAAGAPAAVGGGCASGGRPRIAASPSTPGGRRRSPALPAAVAPSHPQAQGLLPPPKSLAAALTRTAVLRQLLRATADDGTCPCRSVRATGSDHGSAAECSRT
jgi:hypothetical protein